MFIRVDSASDETLEGWSYLNIAGEIEIVSVPDNQGVVCIETNSNCSIAIFHEDIPKLIKALLACHQYKGE